MPAQTLQPLPKPSKTKERYLPCGTLMVASGTTPTRKGTAAQGR